MGTLDLDARRTIECLRSGVPSDAVAETLGTAQAGIERRFVEALDRIGSGEGATPFTISGDFGDGKSHLFHSLRNRAEAKGFVTSIVVVSPGMPIGNAHVTLKAVAEEARAPGRTGKALIELASNASRNAVADLRRWAQEADVQDRFRALLHIFEVTQDDELRAAILGDLEGRPAPSTRVRQELRSLGQLQSYDLKSRGGAVLAHDRLRILARFFRTHGARGLVVFFDELERIVSFSTKARLASYEELGWWRRVCEAGDVPLYAVFSCTTGTIDQCLLEKGDEARVGPALIPEERDELALEGIDLIRSRGNANMERLKRPDKDELEALQHSVRELYERAYGCSPPPLAPARRAQGVIRAEIRTWITHWDLARHFPEYSAAVQAEEISLDTREVGEDELAPQDGEET